MNITTKSYLPTLLTIGGIAIAIALVFALPNKASAHTLFAGGPHSVGSSLDVSMSDSGAVAVHGAKVTAVSGSTITAQTAFGATVLSWTVDTNNSTSFAPKGNASNTLSNVKAGDYISFSGTLDSAAANLTVTANTIRDYSLLPVSGDLSGNAMLSGTVNSVNTSGNTFVLSTKDHGMVTVSVATSTALLNGDGSFLLGNLALGNSVMVKGSYNASTNTIVASSVRVNGEVKIPDKDEGNGSLNNISAKWDAMLNSIRNSFHFHLNAKSE